MFNTVKRILQWTKEYRGRLVLGFICSFFNTWFSVVPIMAAAWCLTQAVESVWGGRTFDGTLVWKSLIVIIGSILFRWGTAYWRAKLQESIGYEVAAVQRIRIGEQLKHVSLGYFSQHRIGDILAAVTTELSVLELQSMKMVDVVVNGYINLAAILIGFLFFCPQVSLIALTGALLSAFALHGISRQSERTADSNHKASEDLSAAAIEYVRGLPVVKSFGQQGAAAAAMKKACGDSKSINIRIEKGFVPWNCLHLLFMKLASVALVLTAAALALQGSLPIMMFFLIITFSFTLFASVENVNDAAHVLGVVDSAMNHLEQLAQAGSIDDGGADVKLNRYDIILKNVGFSYDNREVLHDITCMIPQNSTTAVVGPSGSGKSTLCNLIARFYDVNSGSVCVGGHDVREFTCDSLLKNISMVFQNVYLFHDTIRNNIKFGMPDATQSQIIDAAKAAQCHDFIMALPGGYDTVVGEGGSSLSGGEKQRISIARAILKNAPIVILDEATASIDPENEHLIQQALSALTRGKTIIIIAHRLATIEQADQILVVEDGRIVQRGTHRELIGRPGVYQRFIEVRQRTEGWSIET